MNVEYINPFIESVNDLFSTMLGCEAKRGNVGVLKGGGGSHEITAIIGLSGHARGTVALSFPEDTALAMVSRLLGTELQRLDESVSDALGEMVNIVAGGAKAKLPNGNGRPMDLSLPHVIRGYSYSVDYPSDSAWLDVSFASDLGPFRLRVTLETNGGKRGNQQ